MIVFDEIKLGFASFEFKVNWTVPFMIPYQNDSPLVFKSLSYVNGVVTDLINLY